MPAKTYGPEVGFFQHQWNNPPPPFNPVFDPRAKDRYAAVSKSMADDDFYSTHSRAECADEWKRRYNALVDAEVEASLERR